MSEKRKKPKLRLRYFAWCMASLAVLTAPLTAVLIANRERYFTTVAETVKISIGGMICVVLLVLLVFGRIRVSGGLVCLAIVFALSYLLQTVIQDLFLLSGVALCSKTVDVIFFAPRVRAARERIHIGKTADATAVQVEEVLKKYIGIGRT